MAELIYYLCLAFVEAMESRLRWGRVRDRRGRLLLTLDQLLAAIEAGEWPN